MTKTAQDFVSEAKKHIQEIDCTTLKDELGSNMHILDVREPEEFNQGHIPDAINIPRGMLEFKIGTHPELEDKHAAILVYCKTGGRCALATHTLQQMGYDNVVSLSDGFDAWEQD